MGSIDSTKLFIIFGAPIVSAVCFVIGGLLVVSENSRVKKWCKSVQIPLAPHQHTWSTPGHHHLHPWSSPATVLEAWDLYWIWWRWWNDCENGENQDYLTPVAAGDCCQRKWFHFSCGGDFDLPWWWLDSQTSNWRTWGSFCIWW